MAWKQTTPMTERLSVIALYQTRLWRRPERCTRFNISRKTGDTWRRRSVHKGFSGLQKQRRAPRSCPPRLGAEVAAALLEAKPRHPSWGPRKLLPSGARHYPALEWPAASRAGALFRHAGLSRAKPRRRRPQHPGAPTRHAGAPNEGWTADCTGPFRTGDGGYGSPLTVADADSRDRLRCPARLSTQPVEAQPVCARLFRESGRPEAMRPEHGAPCATPAFCGLSTLSVWWSKRGIRPQRLEPGRPAQHGRHERMPRTLNADATHPPEPHQAAQQARFDRFGRKDNQARPHEALGQRTPASLSHAAPQRMPAKLAEPDDPGHCLVRRVRNAGTCRVKSRQLFLSNTWLQEWIALEETGEGLWSIDFSAVLLARLDEQEFTLRGELSPMFPVATARLPAEWLPRKRIAPSFAP